MKVREQAVDDAKAMPWADEEPGAAACGLWDVAIVGACLEHTDAGGAAGDDAPAGAARARDRLDGRPRQRVPLLVHRVVIDASGAYRGEGRQPDVEAQRRPADAFR